jgi:hypothetical protein
MSVKHKTYWTAATAVRRLNLHRHFTLKDDDRAGFPFKLGFLSGAKGASYLNACLISLYRTWDKLPEVVVISDGTPVEHLRKQLIKWPRRLDIIAWEEIAPGFADNADLSFYANNIVFGKKLLALLWLAKQGPSLYCDTDILWYASPEEIVMDSNPYIKMGRDVGEGFYDLDLIRALGEERCLETAPLNAGLMYLHGDFSTYPKWGLLGKALAVDRSGHNRLDFSEQTAWAILSNEYNPDSWWDHDQVLIKVDDMHGLRYTGKQFPSIWARHYVNTKGTAFWRDFVYMCLSKKKKRKSPAIARQRQAMTAKQVTG